MRRWAAKLFNGATLLGLGGVLVAFFLNGRIDQYLHPQFRPWVLAGGIGFCIAGAVYLVTRKSMDCCIDGQCIHGNPRNPVRAVVAFGVIALPLVAGSVLSKDSYDQQAILNRGFVQDGSRLPVRSSVKNPDQPVIPSTALGGDKDQSSVEPPLPQDNSAGPDPLGSGQGQNPSPGDDSSDQYLPRAADGNVALEVSDLLYSEAEQSLRKTFTGKTIEVIGQCLPASDKTQFKLVRMFIVCCAADARPISVPVKLDKPVSVPDMSWVKVIGQPEYVTSGDKTKVVLKAASVAPTDPPAEAMLY
ncbi:MAG: TIGR03943 family protein [Verrucomicrobia bacterium]|nr:TIGR03943 family protein [Verrucomicrobiota bacterium]